jgi:glycosyltransferase involved in cell wall biosynthesis
MVPYPPNSGNLARAYNLLKGLALKHTVDLVAFVQEPLLHAFFQDRNEALAECRRELLRVCNDVIFLPIERLSRPFGKARTVVESLFEGQGYTAGWLRSAAASRTLRELFLRNKYSIVHFDVISLALYRELLLSVPATLGHHNIESHMMQRRATNERNWLKKAYFWQEGRRLRTCERTWAPRFATNIVCSDLDGERLRRIVPGAETTTIPNGVDCDYFRSSKAVERPDSLIFVGTMNWYPNADAVLYLLREIWPRLLARRPTATLDIVGANAPRSIVESARSLRGVTVHGFVPEIRAMMDATAIYVCPIRDGGGTKLKILDACAMEKCIVAHPIACEGLLVESGINVKFAETASQFVQAIIELLDDSAARRAMGRAARELVARHYSFSSIGKEMSRCLEGIASGELSHEARRSHHSA